MSKKKLGAQDKNKITNDHFTKEILFFYYYKKKMKEKNINNFFERDFTNFP